MFIKKKKLRAYANIG